MPRPRLVLRRWLLLGLLMLGLAPVPSSTPIAAVSVRVLGLRVDVDTRPDQTGVQYSMTAVRGFPTAVHTLVGAPGYPLDESQAGGLRLKAVLQGPAFDPEGLLLEALPNQPLEIADIPVEGHYQLTEVRLEDATGRRILGRAPDLPPVTIEVIDQLLVTQVTSRPLTLEEIRQKGIVVDQSNFTAVNFTVGLTLGSKQVKIDLPVALPSTPQAMASLEPPDLTGLPEVRQAFDAIDIPNFSLAGFQLTPPPEIAEQEGIELPPINGVIVIPGNIGFLNQFFSVILQATNVAPAGSGLVLRQARAAIRLPAGGDQLAGSGDDPLRVARVEDVGEQTERLLERGLSGAERTADIDPQATNQAEFLVEGRREGTHRLDFAISGDLYVPALAKTLVMTGAAAGVVQVKNPTFSIALAHPKVVREGEDYSIFATVTNTSTTPANLFQLGLDVRSLSGARPAEGEEGLRRLEVLAPGQAESFELRLVAETTGEVRGTVFLADEGINGSFLLTTGVGDTGIPLSPDTLVLPDSVEYLPREPKLLFQAVRLLGQAYSVATAPGGALPPEIPRVSKGFVFERALTLARAGLHVRFGETPAGAIGEILMDYLTIGASGETASLEDRNRIAFDLLRRAADAGHDFSDALGGALAATLGERTLADLQADWAARFAIARPHLSCAAQVSEGGVELRLADAQGRALGRLDQASPVARDIPFAARLPLDQPDAPRGQLLLAPPGEAFGLELAATPGSRLDLSLVLPGPDGLRQVRYPELTLPRGGRARLDWTAVEDRLVWAVERPGERTLRLRPERVVAITDPPPGLLGVVQWGKGAQPTLTPTFATGDPLGRMLGVLYSEAVAAGAEDPATYRVADNRVLAVTLQPDRRLAFLLLERPIGPFIPRTLEVSGVQDLAGLAMPRTSRPILADPERGPGAHFKGRVVTPTGEPIPFASVRYIQPLSYPVMDAGCLDEVDVADHLVAEYTADADGQLEIEYVLKADFPPGCPSNPDQWLNQANPRGTQNFKLEARDPASGEVGKASAQVHYDEQRMAFDLIIRGHGSIRGRLLEPDGSPVKGGAPEDAGSPRVIARNLSTGETYVSWVDGDGGYAFPSHWADAQGRSFTAPRVAVGNLILHLVRPADGFSAVTTVNLERAGVELEQDLVLLAPTAYGSVSGRVLESDGVTAAANVAVQIMGRVLAAVELYERRYVQGVIDAAVTGPDGSFRFERVPTGDVQVRALRQSTYEQVDAKGYVQELRESGLTLVFPGRGGAVRGIVRDALGRAVPKAKVAGGPVLTETDEQGQFQIRGLPLGRFTLYAQGPDSPALGKLVIDSLGPGETQEVVISLEPIGSLTGTLYEADGVTPVAGQKVQLWLEPDAGVLAETFTLQDGQFRFEGYPVGDYSVRAVRRDGGDGGLRYASIRFAGDLQDADLRFSGLGELRGRVVQSNGTPAVSDVIVSHKVWRVYTDADDERTKLFRAFIKAIQEQADEKTAKQIEQAMREAGLSRPVNEFYMLVDQAQALRSDRLGSGGEVTGEFRVGGLLAGPLRVAALGPFLAPAEVTGEIPAARDAAKRVADVGDLVLEPATAQVRGTVYLPDGKTPAGPDLVVRLRSLDSSGSLMTARGAVSQPVLPEIEARTDEAGQFHFPLMLRGRFVLTVDTGVPDPGLTARRPEEIRNRLVAVDDGRRGFNVRLYGSAGGVVPAGEILTVDVRLQGAAGLRVKVVAEDGAPVPFATLDLSTASTLDADEESRSFSGQRADQNGEIAFLPVTEGAYALGAGAPGTPARGRAQGEIPVSPADGLVQSVTLTLGALTAADGTLVRADVFGRVTGQVLKADGTPLDHPAQVTVRAQGIDLLATTATEGRFAVADVPGGPLVAAAFEPYTARRGEAAGAITQSGRDLDLVVQLNGLGTVSGSLTDHAGSRAIAGADLVLTPTGGFSGRILTRTDQGGRYTLPGVPLGTYALDAHDHESDLMATGRGLLKHDGETRTTNLRLAPNGSISGQVLAAAGQTPVANASVEIVGPRRRSVRTGRDGRFDSGPWLALGVYQVTVRTDQDGTRVQAELGQDQERLALDLRLAGLGTVEGLVLDPAGQQPEPKAQVTLDGDSPFFGQPRIRFTGADGVFRFTDIPVGGVRLSVRSTLREPELGARAESRLAPAGATLSFGDGALAALRLEDAGSIVGRVLLPDGRTPATGALVALRGTRVRLGQQADEQGHFAFAALPLGDYRLELRETQTNAVATRGDRLLSNGQVITADPIVLDDADPAVVATEPADGATGVDPRDSLVVRFSEPLDPATVQRGRVRVSVAGRVLDGEPRLSEDGLELSFAPRGGFPDLQVTQVVLARDELGPGGEVRSPGLRDLAGRTLAEDVALSFTTGDATPPVLVRQSPAPDASGVPVKTVVRLEFSEPVDPTSITEVDFTRDGKPEQGRLNEAPILGGTVLVFAPARPLSPNSRYRLALRGPIKDLAGNPMDESALILDFATLDTRPPKVVALRLPPDVTPVSGKRLAVTVELADDADLAYVELYRNDQWIQTRRTPPYEYEVDLDPALGDAISLAAVAVDRAGNRSPRVLLPLQVQANQPPGVRIIAPTTGEISVGQTVSLELEASDDIGIRRLGYLLDGGQAGGLARDLDDPRSAREALPLTLPEGHPIGSRVNIQALAEDRLGLVGRSGPVSLEVVDRYPPRIRIEGVADRDRVAPGALLQVTVAARDAGGVALVSLAADGVVTQQEQQGLEPPQIQVRQAFKIQVPEDALGTQTLRITARAVDAEGNGDVRQLDLGIQDRVAPRVQLEISDARKLGEPGEQIHIEAAATDELGVTAMEAWIGETLVHQETLRGTPEWRSGYWLKIPEGLPLGQSYVLRLSLMDAAGNRGEAVEQLLAADLTAPRLSFLAPERELEVPAGEGVEAHIQASDRFGVTRLKASTTGAFESVEERELEHAETALDTELAFRVPGDAKPGADFHIRIEVFDAAGNRGEFWSPRLRVLDKVPPRVTTVTPVDGAVDQAPDLRVSLTFDEPVEGGSLQAETFQLLGPDGPVAGAIQLHWYDDGVTFVPAAPLPLGQEYQVRLQSVADRFGNRLAEPFEARFRTKDPDLRGPRVTATEPLDGADGVALRPRIAVRFDEPLDWSSLKDDLLTLVDEQGAVVAARRDLYDENTSVTLDLAAPLEPGQRYHIRLLPGAADEAGNLISGPDGQALEVWTTTFTTGALRVVRPAPGEALPARAQARLKLSPTDGMQPMEIRVLANGRPAQTARPPDYETGLLTPAWRDAQRLVLELVAIDQDWREITRDRAEIPLQPVLFAEPGMLGLAVGAQASFELGLDQAAEADLPIALRVADPAIARVSESRLVLPSGRRALGVAVHGIAPGATHLVAESARGRAVVIVSVGAPSPETAVSRQAVGIGVPAAAVSGVWETAWRLAMSSPVPARSWALSQPLWTAVSPGPSLAMVGLPRPGRYSLQLPWPVADAGEVALLSSRPEVVDAAAPPGLDERSGLRVVELEVTAASGVAELLLQAGRATLDIPVTVGLTTAARSGVVTPPALVAAAPRRSLGAVWLAGPGERGLWLTLLDAPADQDLPVQARVSDPDLLTIEAPARLPAGETALALQLLAKRAGRGEVIIELAGRELALAVQVGGDVPSSPLGAAPTRIGLPAPAKPVTLQSATVSVEGVRSEE